MTCADLDETISDLDKVRDAIQVFDVCAGLGRPNFHIPIFKQFVVFEIDTANAKNVDTDKLFNTACAELGSFEGSIARAAETSEIMQQAIEGMPTHNDASAVLMGTCPECEGDNDVEGGPVHVSGHFRTCWDPEHLLDGSKMRTDCGHKSMKAVMCVLDRFDLAGEW